LAVKILLYNIYISRERKIMIVIVSLFEGTRRRWEGKRE
jgi:hypothetical protein